MPGMGNRHLSWFAGMFELAMTALLVMQHPAILFQSANDFPAAQRHDVYSTHFNGWCEDLFFQFITAESCSFLFSEEQHLPMA